MKFKFHRSPDSGSDAGDSTGGGVTAAAEGGEPAIETTVSTESADDNSAASEKKTEQTIEAFVNPEKALKSAKDIGDLPDGTTMEEIEAGAAKKEDSKKKEEKKPDLEKKAPAIEDIGEDDDDGEVKFEVKDLEESSEAETVEESTWGLIAKETGLGELEDDNFTSFKVRLEETKKAERLAGVEEGQNLALDKLPEDAKKLYDFLSVEGNTVESFLNPLKIFDQYLALDNRSLVKKDLLLKNFPEEKAEEIVESFDVDGKLDLEADMLRQALKNGKASREESMISEAREKINRAKEKQESDRLAEAKTFKENLGKAKEFFGVPIAERDKALLQKKYEKGYYKAMLTKNPELEVQIAMFLEFQNQLPSLIGNGKRDEGRKQVLNKIKNIGLETGSKSSVNKKTAKGLDAWGEILAKEEEARSGR
jgi:hypothetical protein